MIAINCLHLLYTLYMVPLLNKDTGDGGGGVKETVYVGAHASREWIPTNLQRTKTDTFSHQNLQNLL